MNKLEERLILESSELLKKVKGLNLLIESLSQQKKQYCDQSSVYSAMLSDICEIIFGDNANGAPSTLSYCHASWVCGPVSKPEDKSFVRWCYESKGEFISKEMLCKIKEWEEFLETKVRILFR